MKADRSARFDPCIRSGASLSLWVRTRQFAIALGLLASVCAVSGLAVQPVHAADATSWIAEFVWAPQFCRDHANERSSEACNAAYGLLLRRLHPPGGRKCGGDLSDATLDSAARVISSPRWVKQMWRQDGSCSGKTDRAYFDFASLVIDKIEVPQELRDAPRQPAQISRSQLGSSVLSVNRALRPDAIVAHCGGTFLTQVDICFDDHLNASACPVEQKKVCGDRIDLREVE